MGTQVHKKCKSYDDASPQRIIYCYGEWQSLYTEMLGVVEFVNGLPNSNDLNPDLNNLIIINDLMNEADESVSKLFTKFSHHRNASVLFLVQNLFPKNKEFRTISLNSHYMIKKKITPHGWKEFYEKLSKLNIPQDLIGNQERWAYIQKARSRPSALTIDDDPYDLGEQLTNWSLQFGISLVAFTALLSMLRMYFPNLPKDARTLLKTNTYLFIYLFVGFNDPPIPLRLIWSQLKCTNWPILGLIMSVKMKEPVVIGVYSGSKKLSSSVKYLNEFVKDVKTVICDTPARSFVKNIKSHNGYRCDKCSQSGLYINHRMTYPNNDSLLWTDESFLSDLAEDHRAPNWTIPFPGFTVNFISQFPVDYMHLVCLGVVRRLLNIWLKGKLKTRLTNRLVDQLSSALVQLRSHIPSEFARKPRSVREVDRWKATEFKQFLLYTGPVVLSSIVDETVYQNFMLLLAILICPSLSVIYADYAMSLLKDFVMHYGQIYGKDLIVYNVYGIIHLAEDVKRHGHLDKYSSFPYENHLKNLKKMVRKPKYLLAQIIRRLSEQESATKPTTPCTSFKKKHCKGPVPVELNALKQFEEMQTENFILTSYLTEDYEKGRIKLKEADSIDTEDLQSEEDDMDKGRGKRKRTSSDPNKIVTDFKVITDDMIMLVHTNRKSALTSPKFANVPVASLTTAYARLNLYSVIENLDERLLYFDTDSLIYIDRKGEWSPATGPFLGELKDEVPGDSIIEFAAAGPKNYAYITLKGKSVCKVRGITLNHDNTKLINLQKMKQLIDDHQLYVDVPETRFVRSKKDFSIRNVETSKRYKLTYTKRMLVLDFTTLPYGQ
ncbi:hypothetical protein GQR58_023391 [Nymphon striatum]|nr:hypothetical protein GQR58_023391 [Nymphon striatum]